MSNGSIADNLSSKYGTPSINIFETLRGYIEKNGGNTAGCHSISDLMYRLPEGGGGSSAVEDLGTSEDFVLSQQVDITDGMAFIKPHLRNNDVAVFLETADGSARLPVIGVTAAGGGGGGGGRSSYLNLRVAGTSRSITIALNPLADKFTITAITNQIRNEIAFGSTVRFHAYGIK